MVTNVFTVAIVAALAVLTMLVASAPAKATWGAPIFGNGPYGVAADETGNLYVTERTGNRVVKYSPVGTQLMAFGNGGNGQGQFNSPGGISVESGGAIFVADTGNNRIQRFYPNGSYQTEWGTFGTALGQFKQPEAVAVDGGGNVYVADTDNDRVVKCNAWGWCGAAFTFDTAPNDIGGISGPRGVATDTSGNVYISDSGNSRILKSDSSGNVLAIWSTYGSGQGQVNDPAGLAIGAGNTLFVADRGNARIQRLSTGGAFLNEWIVPSPSVTAQPTSVALGPGTTISVGNFMNNRVDRWDPPTGPTGPTGPTEPTGPTGPTEPTGPTGPTDPTGGGVLNPKPDDDKSSKGKGKKSSKKKKKKKAKQAIINPVKVWKEGGGSVVQPGSSVNIKVSVKNRGDLTARNVYVYMDKQPLGDGSRPSVEVKRGFNIRTLTPGWTVTGTVTIFFGKKARGSVAITAQAWGKWGKKVLHIRR